jgi:phosphoglycerate dehydrogenase-like enzyme
MHMGDSRGEGAGTPRVLYLGPEETVAHVREELAGFEVVHALTPEAVDEAIGECGAVLDAYMKVRFPAERIARAGNLRVFVTATTGADHVDSAALEERGIPLLTLRGQRDVLRSLTPAAEHSWLLLMACARGLRAAVAQVLEGGWDRNLHPGIMLRGRTLGLVGCGRIGQWMATYARAFGMRVVGFDPYLDAWPDHIERRELDELLPESDFVSVHVPLTEETRGLLGSREFALMRPGVVVVNTSRGDILDEEALLAGLRDGRVGAAGLDVLTGEPEVEGHPLVEFARSYPQLVITPHIGGYSPDALRQVLSFSCGRIREHLGR